MRFFHMSDLHIGKQLHERSLLDDQRHMLAQVIGYVREYRPDAVIIAGDVYDKSLPSAEAVTVFDDFIAALADTGTAVMLISGNHDSAERLNYGSRIFTKSNIYVAGMPPRSKEDHLKSVVLKDEYGEVTFWLMPFIKPGYVKAIFADEDAVWAQTDAVEAFTDAVGVSTDAVGACCSSYDSAVHAVIARENIDYSKRNVIVSHQLYTNGHEQPARTDSETISIGGIDNVDVSAVKNFDYAALGHIHRGQKVGYDYVRYCGTMFKYSVSERKDNKALLMIDIRSKGEPVTITEHKIDALHDVRLIKGKFDEIIRQYSGNNTDDYVSVVLTDEAEVYNARQALIDIFPNLLAVSVDNSRTNREYDDTYTEDADVSPDKLFAEFFRLMQGRDMSDDERRAMEDVINTSCRQLG